MIQGQPKPQLSKYLFWDTDMENVDYERNARYVIEKVVTSGYFEDWQEIKRYYGMDKIKECTLRSRNLTPKSLSFLSCILDIPKENFRWYTHAQSNPGLWIY